MATSSYPAARDYLYAAFKALPECAKPTVVSDGFPDQKAAQAGVTVGVTPDDPTTPGQLVPAQLGANMENETYDIPCLLWTWVGGTDTKKARDAAFAMFNAIITKIRADRTLGGALHSDVATLATWSVSETNAAAEAGEGRRCEIFFVIRCGNRL